MPVNEQAIFQAAVMLAEVEEMRVTVKNTFAASAVTALAGTGGFLLLGPAGLFVGSTVAGLGVYSYTKNKFKPVFAILKEDLRPQQQRELIDLLKKAFADLHYTDAMKIFALMMNKQELWEQVRDILMTYVLEYIMKGMAMNNVKVEVKDLTNSERYRKFQEEFKRQNGLKGVACRPATDARANSSGPTPAVAPGWRPDFAPSTADAILGSAAAKPTASTMPPAATAEPTAPTPAETSVHINEPNGPAHIGNWDDSEEGEHLPSFPKAALKINTLTPVELKSGW